MKHLFSFDSQITYHQRKQMLLQEPRLIFLTGLSGSGKSTLALRLEHYLFYQGYKVFLLDGDNVRKGLNKDLGFDAQDRKENIRRVGEVSKLMLDAGLVVICAFISPYQQERQLVQEIVGPERFTEVFVNCPLEVCEQRDTKGLYAKARLGEIQHFTGISAPYEPPLAPDVELRTGQETVEASLCRLVAVVEPQLLVPQPMQVLAKA